MKYYASFIMCINIVTSLACALWQGRAQAFVRVQALCNLSVRILGIDSSNYGSEV